MQGFQRLSNKEVEDTIIERLKEYDDEFYQTYKEFEESNKRCWELVRSMKLQQEACKERYRLHLLNCPEIKEHTKTEGSKRRLRTFHGLSPKIEEEPLDEASFRLPVRQIRVRIGRHQKTVEAFL